MFVAAFSFSQSGTHSSALLNVSEDFLFSQTNGNLSYLKGTENELSAAQALSLGKEHWSTSQSASLNLGISKHPHWFKLHVNNLGKEPKELVLLNSYAPTDDISFYQFDASSQLKTQYQTGDSYLHRSKPIEHLSYAFPFTLDAGQTSTILLKIQTQGNVIVPISVWERGAFFQYQSNYFLIFGILLGVLLITGIYNGFVFYKTREKLFFSFAVFILTVAFLLANQSGMTMRYLWPNLPQLNQFASIFTINIAMFGNALFAFTYLPFPKKLYRFCLALVAFGGAQILMYPFVEYSVLVQVGLLNAVILLLTSLILAVYLMLKGDKSARVYAAAWTPFIIGVAISASIRFEIIEYSLFTEFAGLFFAIVTVVWLSIAIADRLNREKSKRLSAQKEAINNLKRYEDLFEHSIEGIFSSTIGGVLIRANSAFVKMFGYDSAEHMLESVQRNMAKAYKNPKDRDEIIAHLSEAKEIVDEEVELVRANGETFWASFTLRLSIDFENAEQIVEGSMIDISARKISEMKLAYLASHDPLTDLFNRREFEERLSTTLEVSNTENSMVSMVSVLYMDLDQFKVVNDTCGHTVGDKLLKQITQLMKTTLKGRGLLARLGGDEFGLILYNLSAHEAYDIADEILQAIGNYKFRHEKRVFNLGISIGLVELSRGFNSVEDVMSFADTACYAAKDAGRNRIHMYSSDNIEFGKRRFDMELVTAINEALSNDGFRLYKQKIAYNNSDCSLYGYEILLRMENKDGLSYSPSEFIPAAERYGLMLKIDKWVVEQTFEWLSRNPAEVNSIDNCSINLSGVSIGDAGLTQLLKTCFQTYQIRHDKICFEITETHAIEDIDSTIEFIELFQDLGCKFSLDDFGSGLSSYGYLKALPINNVKIDGRFVQGIAADPADYAMVKSIHAVAEAMGKKTIAEYVENAEVIEKLRAIGIDYLQGYAIDVPNPVESDEKHQQNLLARRAR